jgi:hypothetical protein
VYQVKICHVQSPNSKIYVVLLQEGSVELLEIREMIASGAQFLFRICDHSWVIEGVVAMGGFMYRWKDDVGS